MLLYRVENVLTSLLDATILTDITASVNVSVQVTEITALIANVTAEVGDLLVDVTTVAGNTVSTAGDVTGSAVKTVSGTVGGIKSRQLPAVGKVGDLDSALTGVLAEITGTIESVTNVTSIRKSAQLLHAVLGLTNRPATEVLGPLGNNILSLTTVLGVVTGVTSILSDVIPANLLSLLGLSL